MADQPGVCIVSFSNISWDSRVLRQIEYASREYMVDVIGFGKWVPQWPKVYFRQVKRNPRLSLQSLLYLILLVAGRILPRLWMNAYWCQSHGRDALEILLGNRYDIIHASDLSALPVAITAAERTGSKVVFDAREYSPGQAMYMSMRNRFIFSGYIRYLLQRFAPRAGAFITVAPGIADLYRENFKLDAEIVMNAPASSDVRFRAVDPTTIRLIHHGGAKRTRGLEKLIEMMEFLGDRFTLSFMLVGDRGDYVQRLRQLAERVAQGRVFFRDPVPPAQVVSTLSDFDIGAYILPPVSVNQKFALPNKFFDFINAGLAVAIGPSSEMARLVTKYECGVVAKGFEPRELADVLNSLSSEQITQMKRNALKAARSLNADVEMGKLIEIYRRLLR